MTRTKRRDRREFTRVVTLGTQEPPSINQPDNCGNPRSIFHSRRQFRANRRISRLSAAINPSHPAGDGRKSSRDPLRIRVSVQSPEAVSIPFPACLGGENILKCQTCLRVESLRRCGEETKLIAFLMRSLICHSHQLDNQGVFALEFATQEKKSKHIAKTKVRITLAG